jgi:hypothetical protein
MLDLVDVIGAVGLFTLIARRVERTDSRSTLSTRGVDDYSGEPLRSTSCSPASAPR